MQHREFDITIEPNGSVELHVKGFKGKSCLEALKLFEQIVGEVKSRRETSEFYEPDEQVQYHVERNAYLARHSERNADTPVRAPSGVARHSSVMSPGRKE
jgi:hypothetical protein